MRRLSALLACIGLAHTAAASWRLPGMSRNFIVEHLVDSGPLGLEGMVAAVGDVNGDQLLDVFSLSHDQRTLSVYLWDRSVYSFVEHPPAQIHTESDFIIVNVVASDFDYDGKLDVLLMGVSNPDGWWNKGEALELRIYLQRGNGTYGDYISLPASELAQPLLFDGNGDMRSDLLGYEKGSPSELRMWSNSIVVSGEETERKRAAGGTYRRDTLPALDFPSRRDSGMSWNMTDAPFKVEDVAPCRAPSPHSNAFIDLDGDCLADIFLMCEDDSGVKSYQIWLNDKADGFRLGAAGALPVGTKSVVFGDMDRDGTIDMVVTYCVDGTCDLGIAYNSQMPLCTAGQRPANSTAPTCRPTDDLCHADPDFKFSFDPASDAFSVVPLATLLPGARLAPESSAFRGSLPTPPAIGDYNIDGYPDILAVFYRKGGRVARLLESRPCSPDHCTAAEIARGRRAFHVVTKGAEPLSDLTDVESAHWLDLDDDGSLDILVQRADARGGASRRPTFVRNNYFHDAFFMKAQVLNGACHLWCEGRDGEPRYKPYGTSYAGGSFKFTVLDPTGTRRAMQVGQFPQSSYLALNTPYSYFGLGRTNNYVENLFIGSTRHQAQHFINVEGLIPNSQVVIDPYQAPGRSDPSSWTREMYLHPGDWIVWVTLVLGVSIAILGVVVLVLHLNEKKQDELERKSRLLSLNFQAL